VGDPHIKGFDWTPKFGKMTNIYSYGDYWIVKSSEIWIQARYWSRRPHGNSLTRALAVSGPIMEGGKLIIEPGGGSGQVTWNGNQILQAFPSKFEVPDVFVADYKEDMGLKKKIGVRSLHLELSKGVRIVVNRWRSHINVLITMPQQVGGQDGHCGNFNGNPADDTANLIIARLGTVGGSELLFDKKDFSFAGCFADDVTVRDLPVDMGSNIGQQPCSLACSGYKYFGLQGMHECRCGDAIGKYGKLSDTDCKCAAAMGTDMGAGKQCAYIYADAVQPPVTTLTNCTGLKLQEANSACKVAMQLKGGVMPPGWLEACLFDVCFAGPQYAEQGATIEEEEEKVDKALSGWPECQELGILVQAGPAGESSMSADLTKYGVSSGCGNGDCSDTDTFQAADAEECARVCKAVHGCEWWSFGTQDVAISPTAPTRCFLRRDDEHRQSNQGFASGARLCHPPKSCSDQPTAGMVRGGKTCSSFFKVETCAASACKASTAWRKKNFCQQSCFEFGCGYDGDFCTKMRPPDSGLCSDCPVLQKCNATSGDFCNKKKPGAQGTGAFFCREGGVNYRQCTYDCVKGPCPTGQMKKGSARNCQRCE